MAEWIPIVGMILSFGGIFIVIGVYKNRIEKAEDAAAEAAALAAEAKETIADHIKECSERHEAAAKLNQIVAAVADSVKETQKTVTWMGDCIVGLGTSMSVRLPERPR